LDGLNVERNREVRMKSDKVEVKQSGRRDFLKLSASGAVATGGAMLVGKTASAATVVEPQGDGYRLTSHVKKFYDLARF
jgi:hypothetical protein